MWNVKASGFASSPLTARSDGSIFHTSYEYVTKAESDVAVKDE